MTENCHRLEGTKEIQQLNTIWYLGLDAQTSRKRDISGKTRGS